MKRILVILFVCCVQSLSFSAHVIADKSFIQNNITLIQKEVLPNGDIAFTLTSNKSLIPERVDIWEDRFMLTYPEIISIQLSDIDQSIYLVLSSSHSVESLDSILARFDILNYSIQES